MSLGAALPADARAALVAAHGEDEGLFERVSAADAADRASGAVAVRFHDGSASVGVSVAIAVGAVS